MTVFLIVLLAVFLLIVGLCLLRVQVLICCNETVRLQIRILFFRLTLFPKKGLNPKKFTPRKLRKKAKKAARKRYKKQQKQAKKAKKQQKTGAGAKLAAKHKKSESPADRIRLIRALLAALIRATGKHLHLKTAKLHVRVATGDAATTAVAYGAVSGALAGVLGLLRRVTALHTAPGSISVQADFLSERSTVDIKLIFSMRLGGALAALFTIALSYLKHKRQKAARKTAQHSKHTAGQQPKAA